MRYTYLMMFTDNNGYGSLIFSSPRKINNKRTFEEVEQAIREQTHKDNLAIMSFQLSGCEFTYENEDVKGGGVACPDCGQHIVHSVTTVGLYYSPNCDGIQFTPETGYPPKTMLFNTTTGAKE